MHRVDRPPFAFQPGQGCRSRVSQDPDIHELKLGGPILHDQGVDPIAIQTHMKILNHSDNGECRRVIFRGKGVPDNFGRIFIPEFFYSRLVHQNEMIHTGACGQVPAGDKPKLHVIDKMLIRYELRNIFVFFPAVRPFYARSFRSPRNRNVIAGGDAGHAGNRAQFGHDDAVIVILQLHIDHILRIELIVELE